MKINSIAFLLFLTMIFSCSQQQNNSKNIETSTPENTKNVVNQYASFLAGLDPTNINTIPVAMNKYQELFKDEIIESKDSAFVLFDSYYQKVDESANDLMTKDTTNFDAFVMLDENGNSLPLSKKLRDYQDKITQNGFEIASSEGAAYIKQNRDFITKGFYDFVTPTMKEYLEQLNKENKEGFSEDGGIAIEPKEYIDRVIWWENFIEKNKNFIQLAKCNENRKYLLTFLMTGLDNTPLISDENNEIEDFYKTAYSYLQSAFPNSQTNKMIAPYFAALINKDKVKTAKILKGYKQQKLIEDFENP
jgi:uncharacterized protein (UPF0297 family)